MTMTHSLLRVLLLSALPLPWTDPSLELYRSDMSVDGEHARIELCVRPKPGVPAASTTVGYPRYRMGWGRRGDGVVVGLDSTRSLRVVGEGSACFSVRVPRDASTLELPIGGSALEIAIRDRPEPEPVPEFEAFSPPLTRPVSDVDGDVAVSLSARPGALAVVLGVGTYANAPAASFAADDATTAARYFEKSLGIPPTRIELLRDSEVTLGQMQRIFGADGWLARRVEPDSEIFIYFSGHGMAELEKFSPYLLPADADPDYVRQTALSLDRMIEMVAALGARRTTLFLDACFSGLSREGASLLADARPLVIEQAARAPAGLSIFSAGSGAQIVSALDAKGHGIFSYYLFKGLAGDADADHDRRVLASELKTYLEDAVPRAALELDREQTPRIVLSGREEVLVRLP